MWTSLALSALMGLSVQSWRYDPQQKAVVLRLVNYVSGTEGEIEALKPHTKLKEGSAQQFLTISATVSAVARLSDFVTKIPSVMECFG